MRLWSLHPGYLDSTGLIACWREGLLARSVLAGKTTGYRRHPQLIRFRQTNREIEAIDTYLHAICDEATRRGYHFDRSKLGQANPALKIKIADGQLVYEMEHLRRKLLRRSPDAASLLPEPNAEGITIHPHPMFVVRPGDPENWEVIPAEGNRH